MNNIRELIQEDLKLGKIKNLIEKSDEWFVANGYVYTQNFGWVLMKDVDRFDFLKKDEGVPTYEKITEWEDEESREDAFGKIRKVKVKKSKKVLVVAPEWYEWQAILQEREAKKEIND